LGRTARLLAARRSAPLVVIALVVIELVVIVLVVIGLVVEQGVPGLNLKFATCWST
jgi:hypothetical protein